MDPVEDRNTNDNSDNGDNSDNSSTISDQSSDSSISKQSSDSSSSEKSSSISDSSRSDRYLDMVRLEKGYGAVGDLVMYLRQLVCVIISICIQGDCTIVNLQGINLDVMAVDDTSQLSVSPNNLMCVQNFKISPSLRRILLKIKQKSLQFVQICTEKHPNDIQYILQLGFSRNMAFLLNRIQDFLKKKGTKTTFDIPYNFHIVRHFTIDFDHSYCFTYQIDDGNFHIDTFFGKEWDIYINDCDQRKFFNFIRQIKLQLNLANSQSHKIVVTLTKCPSTSEFDPNNYRTLALSSLHAHASTSTTSTTVMPLSE